MNIYLEKRKRDLKAFKKAIELCESDTKTVKVLEKYLEGIKSEHSFADFIASKFMPSLRKKASFYRAFIFNEYDGDYRVEVYVHNLDETVRNEYLQSLARFLEANEETFFFFKIYDIKKDDSEYLTALDYDRMTIFPSKQR